MMIPSVFCLSCGTTQPQSWGPRHWSLYSNPRTGKDGTIHHTGCSPTHVEEWRMVHDGRRGCTTYDLGVCCKSTLWDPPNTTTSASDSLQGPEYRMSDVVRHAGSMATHELTDDVQVADHALTSRKQVFFVRSCP